VTECWVLNASQASIGGCGNSGLAPGKWRNGCSLFRPGPSRMDGYSRYGSAGVLETTLTVT